ncbi:hypothetical protein GJAV_G00243710 [Gymnothorax javanicus]|nr:hypothetical protein GJAV_G00243710 [Gymnothorax javanicus]
MNFSSMKARLEMKTQMAAQMKDEDKLFEYKGVLYPTILSPIEHLEAMVNVEARQDDVLLVSYPKCGFNWMVAVLRKIIAASTGRDESRGPPLLEFMPPDVLQSLSELPSPRFLGLHVHPDDIPPSFAAKKTKILVILRNPKDTAVSYYHFSAKNPVLPKPESWDAFFDDFMSGKVGWGYYFDHAVAWDKCMDNPNVRIITYEEMKQDLRKGIREICEFYSFSLTDEQIQAIAEASTFNAMKESSKDSHGNLGNVFFRKGVVGDWKNYFSEAQNRKMDEEFEKHLAGTKLGAKINYDLYCK